MQIVKRLSIFLLVLIVIGLIKTDIYAQPNPAFYGDAGSEVDGTYTVTMKKIEISEDGSTWVTLGEQTQSFNIASGSAGASIGSYISNSSVPVGTYNYLRITQSRTITIKGRSGDQNGNYYYTTTSQGKVSGFYKAGETLVISGNDMIITKDQSSNPIVISEGQTKSMAISFNTESMIGFEAAGSDYIFYPMAPQESYSEE